METPEDETVILKGQAAVNLWLDGKDAWNKWAAKNPDAKVDFAGFDFSDYDQVSFQFFNFPEGKNSVSFRGAKFGDDDVSFTDVSFGDGDVSFSRAEFGRHTVHFSAAVFGEGNICFSNTSFGGAVYFSKTSFGPGSVDFYYAKFCNSSIYFDRANFGNSSVTFIQAIFDGGDLYFLKTKFGNGNINFSHATCGMGHFAIKECTFGNGKDKSDQKSAITFDHVDFGGRFSFQNCKETGNIQSLSFKGCVFKAGVTLAVKLSCVPDLRGTIVTAHIDLEELQVNSKSRAIEDAPKYRRLKELAERNRHHEAALQFFADERRCMRWARGDKPWQTAWAYLASVLDVIYAGACDYGRSIAWPVGWLGGLISGSTAVLVNCFKIPLWPDALPMVLTSSIPFLPAGRVSTTEHQWAGDVGHLLPYFELWFLGHQFFSFILLFLIGIGLRNRFRL